MKKIIDFETKLKTGGNPFSVTLEEGNNITINALDLLEIGYDVYKQKGINNKSRFYYYGQSEWYSVLKDLKNNYFLMATEYFHKEFSLIQSPSNEEIAPFFGKKVKLKIKNKEDIIFCTLYGSRKSTNENPVVQNEYNKHEIFNFEMDNKENFSVYLQQIESMKEHD